MGNIIGSPFANYVKKQIETRQKALGQFQNISADNLKYYTVKTPWLRLASSINLTDDNNPNSKSVLSKLVKSGVPEDLITGDNLAKNFILQGGTVGIDNDSNVLLKKGLNYKNELFTGAYGWGGIEERGFVPMPGITSATTNYFNNGALTKSTISIQCFSKAQFQLLDVLYLRPGYTLLLEFGWSTYLDNNGNLQTHDGFKSKPLDFLLKPGSFDGSQNQYQMASLLSQERKKHFGNYEGVYGKITNFNWTFNADGSYNCEVHLTGMGSIIESLKLNTTNPNKNNQSKGKSLEVTNLTLQQYTINYFGQTVGDLINLNVPTTEWDEEEKKIARAALGKDLANNKTTPKIKSFLKPKWEALKKIEKINNNNINNNPLLSNRDDTALNKIFYEIYQWTSLLQITNKSAGRFTKYEEIENGLFVLPNTLNGDQKQDGGAKTDRSVFITFATLIKIIETHCNLFSKKAGRTPMMKFDFNYSNMKLDQNFMLIIPPNISTNPGVCLVGYNKMLISSNNIPTDTPLNNNLSSNQHFQVENNPYIGRLGNVLLNLRFITKALATSPIAGDGSISVLSFLQTILTGINSSMGSINNFLVMNDEDEGIIKIYDETPKPGLVEEKLDVFSKINIFGVKRDQGSFVSNVGLNASIPSNFATMVSIGSQASGNNLQGNATSFSNYNSGLIDRIIPEKNDYESTKETKDEVDNLTKAQTIQSEKIYYTGQDKASPFGSIYSIDKAALGKATGANLTQYNFETAVCNDLTQNYTSYLKLVQGILTEENKVPSPFFLPFNLNLEIEGMSGMRMFQKFRISDDILPASYEKDSVEIIVKALNHSVDITKWSTIIDTQSVPRFEPAKIEDTTPSQVNVGVSEKQQKLEAAVTDEPPTDENEDLIVRIRLTRLCDNGYQTLGLMEVLDESGNIMYALPTSELPWKDNLSSKSCIPKGIYNVSSRYSPKYQDCFIISELDERNKILNTGKKITGYNPTDRGWVLIHEAPRAPGWLEGCLAPGFIFNLNNVDSINGNPDGTGDQYGGKKQQSFLDSKKANEKLLSTLWAVGKNPMFQIEILTLGGGSKPLYTNFDAGAVQNHIEDIEDITGDYYTD
jgi:hypothetical protein